MAQVDSSEQFNARNLHKMNDGKLGLAIDHELRTALRDVQERPGEGKARTVVIQLKFKPELDGELGNLDVINLETTVACKLPNREAKDWKLLPGPAGTARFQPHSPKDPRQPSLFPDTEEAQQTSEAPDTPDTDESGE